MNNFIDPLGWKKAFKLNFEKQYINLILYSYNAIMETRCHQNIKNKRSTIWENDRRNMLVDQMRKNKSKFGITFNIATESGVYNPDFIDIGRIDICCYLNELDDQYIAFECKRFIRDDIVPSYIRSEYYEHGIKRFEDNIYTCKINVGGMIAFLESGDYQKLKNLMETELPNYTQGKVVNDCSSEYQYNYVLMTEHMRKGNERTQIYHILMDFT
jgi:hypothetical protein